MKIIKKKIKEKKILDFFLFKKKMKKTKQDIIMKIKKEYIKVFQKIYYLLLQNVIISNYQNFQKFFLKKNHLKINKKIY